MKILFNIFKEFKTFRYLCGGKWEYVEIQGWTIFEGYEWNRVQEYSEDSIHTEFHVPFRFLAKFLYLTPIFGVFFSDCLWFRKWVGGQWICYGKNCWVKSFVKISYSDETHP